MNQPIDELRVMILMIARSLVDHPDAVRVDLLSDGETITFSVYTDSRDTGKIIGVSGRTARALRVLVHANGVKLKRRLILNICSPGDGRVEHSSAAD